MKAERFLSREFLTSHPREAARVLDVVAPESAAAYLEEADGPAAVAVLQNLEPWSGARCILRWPDERIGDVLGSLPATHAARMLRPMENSDRERLLNLVSKQVSRVLRAMLHYPDGTAASRMNPQVLAYPQDLRAGEVWKHLRSRSRHAGSYIYVVDPEGVLVGALSFLELISANPRDSLRSVMRTPVESIPAHAPRETIVEHPGWRRFSDLPVIDGTGILLGVIQYSAFRQLERQRGEEQPWATWHLAFALGELYWVGSSGLLRGLAETMGSAFPQPPTEEKFDDR